jgi:hypothetical protein
VTRLARLEELAAAVGAWRSARCSHPGECSGDNHVSGCEVEQAFDEVTSAHDALMLHGREAGS